jgi:hypothetical protein
VGRHPGGARASRHRYGERGDRQVHRGEAQRAFELKPNDTIVLKALREAYWTMGRTEQATDAHRRALAVGDRSQGGLDSEIKSVDRPSGGGEF